MRQTRSTAPRVRKQGVGGVPTRPFLQHKALGSQNQQRQRSLAPPALAALAFVLLAFATSASAQPQPQPQTHAVATPRGVGVHRVVSPGGIAAWFVEDHTVPMLVLTAYWRGGSAIEPRGLDGVTSVMTDMLTEGAGTMDSTAFSERIEDLNMGLDFSAGDDGVGMSLTTLTQNRDAAFEMARLALIEPRFDAEPLARIKGQLEVGIRQQASDAGFIGGVAMENALYPGHPYARHATRLSVEAITVAALRERRAALFSRNHIQISVVGDIDEAALGRLLDQTFAALPERPASPEPADAVLLPATPLIVRHLPQPQSVISFSAPGIQDDDPDWIPLAVANYILGGGDFSSRLMNEVREKRGLVYGISTASAVENHLALISGGAQSSNEHVKEAIDVTRAEIGRLYTEGATQAEVNDAITYLTGSFALDLDSDVKIASVLQAYQVAGRDINYVNTRNDRIRAVTLADVNRVIRRLFDPAKFTFVVVGQPVLLDQPAASAAAR